MIDAPENDIETLVKILEQSLEDFDIMIDAIEHAEGFLNKLVLDEEND